MTYSNTLISGQYRLEGRSPVPVTDISELPKHVHHVGSDNVGEVYVSTVFLGLEHGFERGRPILFETMIFGGIYDEWQWRYCTYEQAEAGHKKACKMVSRPEWWQRLARRWVS